MHIANSPISKNFHKLPPISAKCMNSPYFRSIYVFLHNYGNVFAPPILVMMRLRTMLYTYWTPLPLEMNALLL